MVRKSMFAFIFVLAGMALAVPKPASAQVAFGVRVGPVVVRSHAFVRPYVVARAPYVAVAPAYVYPAYAYPVYPARGVAVVGERFYPRPFAYRAYPAWRYGWRR
jgi:hypothetical protein